MNVIIAGSRTFKDYSVLYNYCESVLSSITEPIVIFSGGARGADFLAEAYARGKTYELKIFPAKWDIYGRSAGPIRNEEMARNADVLIAFWDGKSAGTKNMIAQAEKNNLKIFICYI